MASNNEPAFPTKNAAQTGNQEFRYAGMSLRDYFAAKIMQAYMQGPDRDSFTYQAWAKASYEGADAMLEARKESK